MGRVIRIFGTMLALTCVGYLVIQQIPNLPALDVSSPFLWTALAISLAFYVLSQCAAAEAWRGILSLSGVELAAGLVRGQPMVSQIGKYIPGNVAHLFGRIAIGRRDGVASGTLAASMVLEVGITLGVGLGVAGLLLMAIPDAIPNLTANYPDLSTRLLPVVIAALLAVGIGIGCIIVKSRLSVLGAHQPSVSRLTRPLALHLASFSILGVSLWAAALAVTPDTAPGLINCTLIFAFAWAAGFVMPGAPGGIGVRDSIVVLGLAITVGEGSALAIALLHRAVSIIGDISTFGLGWYMRHTHAQLYPRNGPEPAAIVAD